MAILEQNFFGQKTLTVASKLLGKKIVRNFNGALLTGMVAETEAYIGSKDSACHAFNGKTPRNSVMYGKAGVAYVYFVYGIHFLLNVVTEEEGNPCAVLLRGLVPLSGQDQMQILRKTKGKGLTDGPAKLCQAMAIDKTFNSWDLTQGKKLWFEDYKTIPDRHINAGPRIGINYADQKDRQALWRFWVAKDYNAADHV